MLIGWLELYTPQSYSYSFTFYSLFCIIAFPRSFYSFIIPIPLFSSAYSSIFYSPFV